MRWPRLPARPMAGLSERDRRALRLGLWIVLPALLYVGGLKPYLATLQETRDRVRAERELLRRELELLAARTELPAGVNEAQRSVQRAEARLVRAPNSTAAENRVTDQLEQIAELSRVLLQEVRSNPLARDEKPPQGLQLLRLAVRGESDLEGVVTYLQRIERSPLLLRVRAFTLENAPPPRIVTTRGRNARPARRAQLGVMQFTMIVEAFSPALSSAGELP